MAHTRNASDDFVSYIWLFVYIIHMCSFVLYHIHMIMLGFGWTCRFRNKHWLINWI